MFGNDIPKGPFPVIMSELANQEILRISSPGVVLAVESPIRILSVFFAILAVPRCDIRGTIRQEEIL